MSNTVNTAKEITQISILSAVKGFNTAKIEIAVKSMNALSA